MESTTEKESRRLDPRKRIKWEDVRDLALTGHYTPAQGISDREVLIETLDNLVWFVMYWRGVCHEYADDNSMVRYSKGQFEAYSSAAARLAERIGFACSIELEHRTKERRRYFEYCQKFPAGSRSEVSWSEFRKEAA